MFGSVTGYMPCEVGVRLAKNQSELSMCVQVLHFLKSHFLHYKSSSSGLCSLIGCYLSLSDHTLLLLVFNSNPGDSTLVLVIFGTFNSTLITFTHN